MFPPRTIRSIVNCALVCGLLAITTSTAAARPVDDTRGGATTSSLAGTTSDTPLPGECAPNLPDGATTSCLPATTAPRQDLRSPDARDAVDAERIARTMEQYYQSYDEPKPATAPAAPAPDDSPWLVVSIIAGGLALVLASAALVLRRRHTPAV
jgi:MYXO-CTERM domain-containing protein